MPKILRITTVPMALRYLLPGQMRYMKSQGYEVVMASADGKEREEVMTDEGCPHVIVPMTRKITPFKDLWCLWKLVKLIRKEKPDIVHTHTPKAGLLGMLAAKICRVKVRIHTVAGLPLMVETGFKFKLLKNIERITYAAATNVWPNSTSLLNYIKAQKLTREKKLTIIGRGSSNGINLNRFNRLNLKEDILEQVKASVQYNPTKTYLVCIGRLVKDKGITELLEAFMKVQTDHYDTKLILVGQFETELDPLPAHILEEIKTNPDITHINWSQHVEYYLLLANLFIFPSHREGFPNVLLQAGALKVPVICSIIPGNIDIVENDITGLHFPVGDTNAIQQHIDFALNNPSYMQAMSERLHENITKFYARENIWRAIQEEYVTLLKKNAEQ